MPGSSYQHVSIIASLIALSDIANVMLGAFAPDNPEAATAAAFPAAAAAAL